MRLDSVGLPWWFSEFDQTVIESLQSRVESCSFSQGLSVEEFERSISQLLGFNDCICVTSGTAALTLALMSLDIEPGDEVIVPDRSWIATSHSARILGANVRVCPVDGRFLLDVEYLKRMICNKTKAIVPVFMNGRMLGTEVFREIKELNIPIVCDAAQAFSCEFDQGQQMSNEVDIAIFSFSVTKTISSGQGGAITTNDERLAKKLKALRTHGLDSVFNPKAWPNLGFNFRMTDLTACVGLHQLKMIEAKISGLKSTYDYYRKRLDMIKTGNIELIPVRVDQGEIPQYIEVHSHRGNDLQAYLSTKGIETRPFFPPLSSAPYIISEEHGNWLSPNISESHFIIPSGPDRSEAELSLVCDEIGKFFGE